MCGRQKKKGKGGHGRDRHPERRKKEGEDPLLSPFPSDRGGKKDEAATSVIRPKPSDQKAPRTVRSTLRIGETKRKRRKRGSFLHNINRKKKKQKGSFLV